KRPFFNTILVPLDPRQTRLRVDVKNDGQIRRDCLGREFADVFDEIDVDTATVALVDDRGIEKPVAEDDLPLLERRFDDLVNELGARRHVQERLAFLAHRLVADIEQDVPDLFADQNPAGLAHKDDGHAFSLQVLADELDLRAFPGAFRTFEGDEFTFWHQFSLRVIYSAHQI